MRPNNPPVWWNETLDVATPLVSIEALNSRVSQFVVRAGRTHYALFGSPLVITSGNDGQHVPGSAHGKNGAVDLRSRELDEGSQMVFALCLISLGLRSKVVVYDERAGGSPHWHCEDADMAGG